MQGVLECPPLIVEHSSQKQKNPKTEKQKETHASGGTPVLV